MKIISIDPGSTESAYVVWDGKVIDMAEKVSNQRMLAIINSDESEYMVIEKITSYGMAVGETTFDTVYWTGRFCEAWSFRFGDDFARIPRHEVKMHLCHSTRAKDANIIQALRDRFAYGVGNYGKGTKKEPGFFYGFKKDIWQAFALAVYWWDSHGEKNE